MVEGLRVGLFFGIRPFSMMIPLVSKMKLPVVTILRSKYLRFATMFLLLSGASFCGASAADRPNIVWIMLEDWGPDMSCYGTKGLSTPRSDKLADEGIRYTNAFCTSPVCSTSRSAMITGFHQNYIGAQDHRLYDDEKRPLPYGIKTMPLLLKEAGYYTILQGNNKTDSNYSGDLGFSGKDWSERKTGQPFYAQMTLGGTHRTWKRDSFDPIDPKDIELPPYYADTPFNRRDWANGLEQMQICDREIG
ncbi:MAG: N-sulfoglucosamine sulfohydrolase [Candidatus Pelagisphaera sp.]|jgi:N-sulfoglucosamine sulfohydrolase